MEVETCLSLLRAFKISPSHPIQIRRGAKGWAGFIFCVAVIILLHSHSNEHSEADIPSIVLRRRLVFVALLRVAVATLRVGWLCGHF